MTSYKVVAPYVTLKVKDDAGSTVVRGYYEGGIVENVADEDQAKAQVELGLLEVMGKSASKSSASKQDAPPAATPPDEAPAKSADKATWVDWAVSQGASQQDAEAATKDELVAKYGS